MRALLTGAGGFLGRHVLASPAAAGWTIVRATRGVVAAHAREVAMGPGSWTRADFARALEAARPDIVIHCAGRTHSPDARATFEANTLLAAELLAAIEDVSPTPRVILIGSAAEYGFVPESAQPVVETQPCVPRTVYGIAKHAQTQLALAAAARGLPVLVVRLFNPVGEGMPPGLALPSFARQLAGPVGSRPLLRVGDLSVQRDFLDVMEAARLLIGLAAMPKWPWPVVNMCSGRAYRLSDLLQGLVAASLLEAKVEIDPALLRDGDMPMLVGDTRRLVAAGLAPSAPDFARILPILIAEARKAGRNPSCPSGA